jgi:hypothetical protein
MLFLNMVCLTVALAYEGQADVDEDGCQQQSDQRPDGRSRDDEVQPCIVDRNFFIFGIRLV